MKDQNRKRKNQDSFPTSSKRLKCPTKEKTTSKASNIEEIFLRFPIIGAGILNQIDHKSLIKLFCLARIPLSSTFLHVTSEFYTNSDLKSSPFTK